MSAPFLLNRYQLPIHSRFEQFVQDSALVFELVRLEAMRVMGEHVEVVHRSIARTTNLYTTPITSLYLCRVVSSTTMVYSQSLICFGLIATATLSAQRG